MLQINSLSENVLGRPVLSTHTAPHKYSGELFGVQYLYAQSGDELPTMVDEEVERDEGFSEEHEELQEYPETIDATLSSDDDSEVHCSC